ncbi:DUF2147 domain-containing protein [Defluviimonas sp. WL0050]|uniref:DUF2147 domain-containing protein n=1 Tax=Albidovulum litorale TaxID=2984134 RepID=A0ABT2ZL99_9RHOB|nr:DUF2147 domain-containing protein [Defluviimonas sp. WL0050]MCV2871894.1 DUF2147 domain-containing protein [Defluviimonas sp. WL0050]
MKKLAIAALLSLVAGAAMADPVEGVWQTEPDDGSYAHITIAPCGAAYCGVISRTFKAEGEYASPNLGKTLVIDMVPNGEGNYAGKVWRPSNDKIYIGKIELNGDNLKLAGCIAGGLLCSKQSWQRVK